MHVDHVTPVALGGSDHPSNLVCACKDCNLGKTSVAPDSSLVEDVKQDAFRWAAAIKQATEERANNLQAVEGAIEAFRDEWSKQAEAGMNPARHYVMPFGWEDSIQALSAQGLSDLEIRNAVRVAMRNARITPANKFKYFCGVAWKTLGQITNRAQDIVNVGTSSMSPVERESDTASDEDNEVTPLDIVCAHRDHFFRAENMAMIDKYVENFGQEEVSRRWRTWGALSELGVLRDICMYDFFTRGGFSVIGEMLADPYTWFVKHDVERESFAEFVRDNCYTSGHPDDVYEPHGANLPVTDEEVEIARRRIQAGERVNIWGEG
ncbi:HNH endonuclease [Rhodococcus qingshengii]|uniref:HNH endonuclease n=1 Tax=Rhodococcus qingshengii TaxID=334542 RepID=UPI003D2AFB47